MNYRKFGNTELMVSEIGFGAWAIGGTAQVGGIEIGWGPSDDKLSMKALKSAKNAGINFFDTADFYGLGHSETLIGKAFPNDQDIIVATKVGQRAGKNGNIEINYSKAYIMEACEKSLRRLKREYIDYYQFHVAKVQHLKEGECIEAMERLKEQGKIRYWGSSLNTFSPEPEAQLLIELNKGQGFQLVFNLINQLALPIIRQAAGKSYGIIARMPLQFGLLSGKIRPDKIFSKTDHRSYRLSSELVKKVLDILEQKVQAMAEKYGTSLSSLALSYILSFPEISTVIPGIRTPEQVQLNTQGLVKLSLEDRDYLENLADSDWGEVLDIMRQMG
ncbi:aldo/keto reductase [Echinicola shivajiensis]|uniref:aldo/keto reductase n=1 Tax=Echinicola shivajiensis TaxID=1035916 RepID=UPI001BFC465B|nr:aldo/keto reductase [Echinicola shivajiensis]